MTAIGLGERTLAGVDVAKGHWIAAIEHPDGRAELRLISAFRDLTDRLPGGSLIVVDMPIGLPDRIVGTGRAAEQATRNVLRNRRSSVFSMPGRAVVEAHGIRMRTRLSIAEAFVRAGQLARTLSDPPRGISIQGFGLLPYVAEIDALLRVDRDLAGRVFEGHPELAFAVLNDGAEMEFAKTNPAGLAERHDLLVRHGIGPELLAAALPRPAAEDDWLDACVLLLVARRVAAGVALSFPDPPERDRFGLPIAIRA
ncbi:DUF429 domain-containing protein [Aureimonas pseudogalii]|uniref:Putative RNase H-like nuclease n=1 Tax=Aureimonas pseudogalii TaxID=1744844 RepID=A0A7W6EGG8_9HYPH|nr:DUF429 domain-containing protein [Aureimonas pseudogalii]MBB3997514.1 putative RNase H-like nuclease [Aureimonas pseudogalii]